MAEDSSEHRAVSVIECSCGYGRTADANGLNLMIPWYLRAKALRMHLAVTTGTL